MKLIPLTKGQFAIVDDEDYEYLMQWKWHASKSHRVWYAARFEMIDGRHKMIFMHREIIKTPEGMETDHKDNNGLNNKRGNLRACTHTDNIRNQRPQPGRTSPYKGVHWCKRDRRWRTKIIFEGKYVCIGDFVDEICAAKAYDEKAKELFGEFAYLNFNEDGG